VFALVVKIFLPGRIAVVGNEFGAVAGIDEPRPKHVILVNTFRQFTVPDPAASQLVAIAAFIEKNVTKLKP
jgi:hypothetical protein